ncbi:MAG TPA: hypothetical protein VHS80_14420, partial [Chthoniobacterales bacterium]|nr:hypothetical protein [Chthoniobacterales bacterium]
MVFALVPVTSYAPKKFGKGVPMPPARSSYHRNETKNEANQTEENSGMNTDSGLFHLSMAVRSIGNGNSFAQAQES